MYPVSFEDKIILVTGAAMGIGKQIALAFAKAGAKGITVMDLRTEGEGEKTRDEIEALGTEVLLFPGDVSDEETVKKALADTLERFGRIDVIVNNAGISRSTGLFDTTADQWDMTMKVNVKSMFLMMKYGAPIMKEQGGGCFVNSSSIAGITGGNTGPDYGASKAAVIALTKFAAKQLAKDNIRVNAIAPGTIATDMIKRNYAHLSEEDLKKRLSTIPMGRMGDPAEVAKAVLFLASDLASYVCGEILEVTGARMS